MTNFLNSAAEQAVTLNFLNTCSTEKSYTDRLVRNICIAMANRSIPKIFLKASVAGFGSFFESHGVLLRTMKMINRLAMIPSMISIVLKLDRKDKIVVRVPAPASKGNAIGTMLPELDSELSDLKK